jgi:UDP-glucose 4-epimerase
MKKVLITGSSGYIGQHLVKLLKKEKYEVYGLDKEHRLNDYLKYKNFCQHDITHNWPRWFGTLNDWPDTFDTIVHLAALVKVNESVLKPIDYYNTNINGVVNILQEFDYKNFVFASTGTAANPINPYALSKRCAEDIVGRYCIENTKTFTSFRFYNVIGSDGIAPTNMDGLMYNLMKARETGSFNLYGGDYNTPDGTPVRDYVHVNEICHSIQKAIETPANSLENLGHGKGHTVKEMVDVFKLVNNCDFTVNYCQRREGDLECSVLDNPSSYMDSTYTLPQLLKV